ncbi:MAG: AAA family ATPase [Planctomycetota bacterium]|nr:AAA family ATPase [Planctomycetota bacterium]
MGQDRITQIRVKGMRALGDVTLDLKGLTVLIGDNGSGKSTLLDAFEMLRQAAKPGINYVSDIVVREFGGLHDLLRHGADELVLGVVIEGNGPKLDYSFALAFVGTSPRVASEQLYVYDTGAIPTKVVDLKKGSPAIVRRLQESLLAPTLPSVRPSALRLCAALSRIDHHVPFETRPLWQQREFAIHSGPRWPSVVVNEDGVSRYGGNLANCFQQLRNSGGKVWERVVETARLGLGDDLRDFKLTPYGQGSLELEVVFGAMPDKPVAARNLSEGQLAFLLFIALAEMNQGRSILVFDEPELHMHPALLARVVTMLEEVAKDCPVVLATHSDRLLDALANPAESVVLCELDERRAVQLKRPNAEQLHKWLQDYRGLGALRAEGYEAHVFDQGDK